MNGGEVIGKSGLTKDQLLLELIDDAYKATPELEREMPKKFSKILHSISLKQPRQQTAVEKLTYSGGDCEKYYKEKWQHFISERDNTKRYEENLVKRQERYIKREQEYRKTIEELQDLIKKQSINPFRIEGKGGEEEDAEEKKFSYIPTQKSQEIVHDYKEIVDIIDMIQVKKYKCSRQG